MANIYELRRYGKAAFLVAAAAVVAMFLYFSSSLISDLQAQERQRMEIWAGATRELVASAMEERPGTDVDFLLGIIQQNTNIPVLLTDSEGNILDQRNFRLPAPDNSSDPRNTEYLGRKLGELKSSPRRIEIDIAPGVVQYLYYEDSTLLRRMSVFPYIQLLVMLAFIAVVYFAVLSTKKAEQNKVWVGLSKETAHQLGTPISSLMAWMELLPDYGVDADTLAEMSKDVNRLSTIASRFSKIGSEPRMELVELRTVVAEAVDYMGTRISPRISLTFNPGTADDPQVNGMHAAAGMGDREPDKERCRRHGRLGKNRRVAGRHPHHGGNRGGRHRKRHQPEKFQDGVQPRLHYQKPWLGAGSHPGQTHCRAVPSRTHFRGTLYGGTRHHFPHRIARGSLKND